MSECMTMKWTAANISSLPLRLAEYYRPEHISIARDDFLKENCCLRQAEINIHSLYCVWRRLVSANRPIPYCVTVLIMAIVMCGIHVSNTDV